MALIDILDDKKIDKALCATVQTRNQTSRVHTWAALMLSFSSLATGKYDCLFLIPTMNRRDPA